MIGLLFGFILFIVVPILIVGLIVSKNKDYSKEWKQQYQNLQQMQYNGNFAQSGQQWQGVQPQSQPQNIQPQSQPQNIQPQSMPQEYVQGNTFNAGYAGAPQPYQQPVQYRKTKPQREPLATSTIMLIIGVVLLVLSGIAFAAANWFNAEPVERVFTIFFASGISFLISVIFLKLAKLKETSASFFSIGCMFVSIALLTAGHYELFGEWFSLHGDGYGLFAGLASAVSAAGILFGSKYFKFKGLTYTGLGIASISVFLTALESTAVCRHNKLAAFSLTLLIIQFIIVLCIYLFKLHEKTSCAKAVKLAADISIALYSVIPAIYTISNCFDPISVTYIILIGYIAELIYFGIKFNKKFMLVLQTIVSEFLAFVIFIQIDDNFSDFMTGIMCGILFMAVYFINRFIPKLRNDASSFVSVSCMMLSAISCAIYTNMENLAVSLVIPFIISFIVLMYSFSPNKGKQQLGGLVSTVIPFAVITITALNLSDNDIMDYDEAKRLVFGIGAALMGITALIINYLPEIFPTFALKYPRKSDMVLYANVYTASAMLMFSNDVSSYVWISMAAAAILFVVSFTLPTNIPSILPAIEEILCVNKLTEGASGDTKWLQFGMFVILMVISVLFCRNDVISRNDGRTKIDTALFTGWLPIIMMFGGNKTAVFLAFVSAAIYAACFVKKNTAEESANIFFTVSAFCGMIALFARPFLNDFSDMAMTKITLVIIALAGGAVRVIWRKYSGGRTAANIIFIISYAGLLIDTLHYHSGGNTLFTLVIATIMLIISFMSKSKTWFTVSVSSISVIIIYSAVRYLDSLSWWVYLFAAGLILIGIAAANEYFKQKGETIKSGAASLFEGWKW